MRWSWGEQNTHREMEPQESTPKSAGESPTDPVPLKAEEESEHLSDWGTQPGQVLELSSLSWKLKGSQSQAESPVLDFACFTNNCLHSFSWWALLSKVQGIQAVENCAFQCAFQMLVIRPCLTYRKTEFIGRKCQRSFFIFR